MNRTGKTSRQVLREKAKKIKLLLLDVDGVLTDGSIILDNQGNELKAFHVRDGHGIKLAQRAGVVIGVITGRKSDVVNIRCRELGITEVNQGAHDKIAVYEEVLRRHGLADESAAFVGDDIVDAGIFRRVGLAITVADADPAIVPLAHMRTKAAGGRGAVREVTDFLLACQGTRPVT